MDYVNVCMWMWMWMWMCVCMYMCMCGGHSVKAMQASDQEASPPPQCFLVKGATVIYIYSARVASVHSINTP